SRCCRSLDSFPTRRSSDLVRRIQALAPVAVCQYGDTTIVIGAGDAPTQVLAGNQTALPVAHIAIGVIGFVPPHMGLAGHLVPPQDRKSTRLNSSHVKISYA